MVQNQSEINEKPAYMVQTFPKKSTSYFMAKHAATTHYSAILQILSSNVDSFFSVSEIGELVRLQFPLMPCRETILSVIHQLEAARILDSEIQRRYAKKIPVTVYKFKIN